MNQIEKYKQNDRKNVIIGIGLLILCISLIILFTGQGAMAIGFFNTQKIIIGKIFGSERLLSAFKDNEIAVVWNIRLPRVICGVFVGGGLAMAGAMFQSLLRNPLADPYTLGVSTGAAFGASLALLLNILYATYLPITPFAFTFAFITLILVIFIAEQGGGLFSSNLIIAGIIVGSILSAGISFIKMTAGEDVSAIVFWLMGSLASKTWSDVYIIVPVVVISGIIGYYFADDLNIMTAGENNAITLGVNTKRTRMIYLIVGSCITAACVSISGIIGFVGLVIPHLLRYWRTSDNRVIIPLSMLLGGIILSFADNITRLAFTSEIPVGVLTTLIGGPFFIYVFISKDRRMS